MFKIALCDDMDVQLEMLKDIVNGFCDDNNIKVITETFSSGEQLLNYIKENGSFDIYVLDMIFPGIKGIEIGRKLRDNGDNGEIIYLTATGDYAVESYQVGAFFYILKPIDRRKIYDILHQVFMKVSSKDSFNDKRIEVRNGKDRFFFHTSELLYAEIVNRRISYKLSDGRTIEGPMLRGPFSQAVGDIMTDRRFVLAGNHLLVNTQRVSSIDNESIIMDSKYTLYPSKSALHSLSVIMTKS